MGSGFLKKKKQAKLFQQQMSQMQDTLTSQLEQVEVTGTSGNGLVTITLNGVNDMKRISIKPECIDPEDADGLETLIKAAYADAQEKLKTESNQNNFAGMPGLEALFS